MKRVIGLVLVILGSVLPLFAQTESVVLVHSHGTFLDSDEMYDGVPVDWFDVEAPADGRLEIKAVSVDVEPLVLLRQGGSIEQFAGNRLSAVVTRPVVAHERIAVGISAHPGSDPLWEEPGYTVQIVFKSGIEMLVVGGSLIGDLSQGDQRDETGSYIDWYPLAVTGGTRVRVSVSSLDFDTYLIVESPDGQTYENDDTSGTDSSVSFVSGADGTAKVGVRAWSSGDTGQYELRAVAEEVIAIHVGESVTRVLDGQMVFDLVGLPDQVVDVRVTATDLDTTLTIEDPDGAYLYNDDSGTSIDPHLLYSVGRSGGATITVGSYGGVGDFTLTVEESDKRIDEFPDGYELRDGDVLTGRLLSTSPQLDGVYAQRFTFTANADERIEITLESDSFDPFLRLIDPRGFETTDDDSAGGYNARITFVTERPGVHEVFAMPLGAGETGIYTISYRSLGSASAVLTTRGQLTPNDARENGKSYDVHSFRATAGRAVVIDVMSDAFDTMISVRDQSGTILAEDDDGGNDSNSRIEFVARQTGTYELWVTSFSSGSYGNYTVSIYE